MERFVLDFGGVGWVDVDGDVTIVNRRAGAVAGEGDVRMELVEAVAKVLECFWTVCPY